VIAVVTGASAGVGRATALEFARRGHDAAILARNAAAARSDRRGALRVHGGQALPVVAEVADAEAVEEAAARVEARLGAGAATGTPSMISTFASAAAIKQSLRSHGLEREERCMWAQPTGSRLRGHFIDRLR